MASSNGRFQLHCADYHVAWICPVADIELLPAQLMLDEEHIPPLYNTHYDENAYIFGTINGHTVVIATCPQGETGNVNAGRLTGSLFKTFPNIRMAVLVGIGGGIPRTPALQNPLEDIHLGDVVVGWPGDGKPACVYHDRGRAKAGGEFEMVGTMQNPDWRLTNAISMLALDYKLRRTKFHEHLARLRDFDEFTHPGLEHDRLFKAGYPHAGGYGSDCTACDPKELVPRPLRTEDDKNRFVFHQGRIATGNAVIQDGKLRDEIRARCDGALCVEMEAAGVNVNRPCLVIRGISDYADSHKSDLWRSYAAGRAAAFARELLGKVQPAAVCTMEAVRHAQIPGFVRADYMHSVLLAPQGQANRLSQRSNSPQHTSLGHSMQGLDSAQKAGSHSSLKTSIKTFQQLHLKEGTVLGDAAGCFVSKLARILKSVSAQQNDILSVQLDGGVEVLEGFNNISPQDLKRLRNILKSSHSVCVNGGPAKFEALGDGRLTQKRSMQVVNTQGHEISIMLLERSFSPAPHDKGWRPVRHRRTETIAKFRIAQTSGQRAFVTAYIHYIQGPDVLQTLNPVISVGKTLPRDSLVFTIVRNGDVDQLKRLLAERRTTLRDRDTNGTPFLHYAMDQPEMCKFLVENGVDIDEIAPTQNYPESQRAPLAAHISDEHQNHEKLIRIRRCRRLLLDAGADPTLSGSGTIDLLYVVLSSGTLNSLTDVLDNSGPFINLTSKLVYGEFPLLLHASNPGIGKGYSAVTFEALLDRGADIHARDTFGRTCLHVAVVNANCNGVKREVRALILLIERMGRREDIFTLDYDGRSIFDDAYECDHDGYWPTGSYRGDLWDHVLIRCGLGEYIRPPEQRIHHYTNRYSEKVFRSLWDGWQHLFPYPDKGSSSCPVLVSDTRALLGTEDEEDEEDEDMDKD